MRHLIKRSLKYRVVEPARHHVDHARATLAARPVTRLCVISDDLVYTSEQQIAPFSEHRELLRAELGVVFARMLLADALALSERQLQGYDVLLLKLSFRTPAEEAVQIARTFRERAGSRVKLIYLDGDDDLCVQWPEVLPLVDLYVKKQVFADASEYTRSRIGKTNLTDYVSRMFGVSFRDDRIPASHALPRNQIHKVVLGWNVALDDKIRALARSTAPVVTKDFDVICRASVDPKMWLHPLRSKVVPILRGLADEYRVLTPESRVSQDEYYDEMRRSRICVSPFGYGEICWRDFEAVLCGCLLVKPDVGHLRTEPDVFVPYATYVPVRWNYSDLEGVIRHYLRYPEVREPICRRAREALLAYDEQAFVRNVARVLDAAGVETSARKAREGVSR